MDNKPTERLVIFTDGGSRGNPGPSACAIYLPQTNEALGKYLGTDKTNNQAEYAGVLLALDYALQSDSKNVNIYSDSQVIVYQIQGKYRCNSQSMSDLWTEVMEKISRLDSFQIDHIRREANQEADAEVNRVLDERKECQAK